jgi:hypothetical protein
MKFADSQWAALVRHPSSHGGAIRSIDVHALVGGSGMVVFRYVLRGDISCVRIPPATPAERTQGLWKHTCFEAFIKAPGAADYYELNFAPSRQWALYRFSAYREGMSSPDLEAFPDVSVRRFADRLEVDAAVPLHDLTGLKGAPQLQVALSAVVEEENGTLSYWEACPR